MKISIKGTNLALTEELKQYVEEKIGNLDKYIQGVLEAKVELERERKHHTGSVFRSEAMMIIGGKVLRADANGSDIYEALDLVIPKLKEQISKFKSKRETMARRGARSAKKKR